MFLNAKYATKGFQTVIPFAQQLLLFQLINELTDKPHIDYLQVFELSTEAFQNVEMQRIIHKQEQPEFQKSYLFPITPTVNIKVFVIDDEDHHTFLLAEKY